MGAPMLLSRLRAAGLALTPTGDGGLTAAPRSALSDLDRAQIREHKAELLKLLMPTHEAAAAVHEALEERAAVRQYDGGMTRAAAETEAAGDLGIRALCLHCAHRSIRRTCLEPVRAGLASSFELVFTELLPDADCPAFAPKVAAA